MHVHFVGVAGTGMGALAGLFKAAGHDVSGSDVAFYPPMGPALERWGIRLVTGFDAKHLDPKPDLVVVGNVCRKDNPEARAAIDGGIPYASMAHALRDHVLAGRAPLVVGGTHGKTTTSAMAAWLLFDAGRDPGFLIGGLPKNFATSFRLSDTPIESESKAFRKLPMAKREGEHRRIPFVVEGDEYDTAFFEKTPKFWHYAPEIAIVTSIEHDHIDVYPDDASYVAAFRGFVERLPESGLLVAAADDARVVELAKSAKCPVAYYALDGDDTHGAPPHWMASPAETTAAGQSFDIYAGGVLLGRAAIRSPGRHNVRNALAAMAAACQGFGVDVKKAMAGLASFEGVARRQDLLFEARGVSVYDDFAHHPTAVRETLAGLRRKHPTGKLFAVFEPRSATACRKLHQDAYATAFDDADRVVFSPVGRPEIADDERLDLGALVAALDARAKNATAASSVDAIVDLIDAEAKPGDTVALLSNGAFGGIYEKLRARLAGG
jgi:UDP-N-acetylmuramate: L-alanyl-gamma-D-glutamyl-meso-diaminopimelate ligase